MIVFLEQQEQCVAAELDEAAVVGVGHDSRSVKQASIASVTCSAPSLPTFASFSDSFVKPEMSTKTTEPSVVHHVASGSSERWRSRIRGT